VQNFNFYLKVIFAFVIGISLGFTVNAFGAIIPVSKPTLGDTKFATSTRSTTLDLIKENYNNNQEIIGRLDTIIRVLKAK